jgi:hypothetical protein
MADSNLSIRTHLLETNIVGVFTETLTAQVDAILPDETVPVCARPAEIKRRPMINTEKYDLLLYIV